VDYETVGRVAKEGWKATNIDVPNTLPDIVGARPAAGFRCVTSDNFVPLRGAIRERYFDLTLEGLI